MQKYTKIISLALMALVTGFMTLPALAEETGAAKPWETGFQHAATPVADRIHEFHHMLLYIITAITVLVMALLAYVMLRFNKKANPEPSTRTHNVPLEIIWTVVPILILIVIVIPSMKLLFYADRTADPEMTLKVTGYQWYWGYEYPDYDNISFMSNLIPEKDIDPSKGQKRLLSTDNPVVLPVDTNIQVLVTSADVIHSFAVPSFGIKIDAVPGRVNETWIRIENPGMYYGQCSELCGQGHGYMPIDIKGVSKEDFKKWIEKAKEEFAYNLYYNSSVPQDYAMLGSLPQVSASYENTRTEKRGE